MQCLVQWCARGDRSVRTAHSCRIVEFEGLMPDGDDGGGRRDERKAQALETSRTGDATNDDPAGDEAGPNLVWKGEGNGQVGFSVEDHGNLGGGEFGCDMERLALLARTVPGALFPPSPLDASTPAGCRLTGKTQAPRLSTVRRWCHTHRR